MKLVTVLPVITTLDLASERVLESALAAGLKGCIVIGTNQDGTPYFASTWADGGDILWHTELMKLRLMGLIT